MIRRAALVCAGVLLLAGQARADDRTTCEYWAAEGILPMGVLELTLIGSLKPGVDMRGEVLHNGKDREVTAYGYERGEIEVAVLNDGINRYVVVANREGEALNFRFKKEAHSARSIRLGPGFSLDVLAGGPGFDLPVAIRCNHNERQARLVTVVPLATEAAPLPEADPIAELFGKPAAGVDPDPPSLAAEMDRTTGAAAGAEAEGGLGDMFGKGATPPSMEAAILPEAPPDAPIDPDVLAVTKEVAEANMREAAAEAEAPATPTPNGPPTVCRPGQDGLEPAPDGLDVAADFVILGRLKAAGLPVQTFSLLDETLLPEEPVLTIDRDAAGALWPLDLPFGRRPVDMGPGRSVALRLIGDKVVLHSATETPPDPVAKVAVDAVPLFRFAVLADPSMLAISGMAQLDDRLQASLGGSDIRIDWISIQPSGALAPAQSFASFQDLQAAADAAVAASGGSPDALVFNSAIGDNFAQMLKSAAAALSMGDGPEINQVFLLMEGQVLPHTAPSRLEAFIEKVDAEGRIARKPRGEPRTWLSVIAGSFADAFSEAYLVGPLRTTAMGEIFVEDRDGSRSVLLTNPDPLAQRLDTMVRSRLSALGISGEVAAVAPVVTPPEYYFRADQTVVDLGLAIRAGAAEGFVASTQAVTAMMVGVDIANAEGLTDVIGLSLLRSSAGVLEPRSLAVSDPSGSLQVIETRLGPEAVVRTKAWLAEVPGLIAGLQARPECGWYLLPLDLPG